MIKRIETLADQGDSHAKTTRDLLDAHLEYLTNLESVPDSSSKTMMQVRQSKRYPLWRLSHPYIEGIAVRTIAWFPDDDSVVIAVLASEKAGWSEVFYDGLGDPG